MKTVYAIDADRQEHIHNVEDDQVAKHVKMMKNKGYLKIKVINYDKKI